VYDTYNEHPYTFPMSEHHPERQRSFMERRKKITGLCGTILQISVMPDIDPEVADDLSKWLQSIIDINSLLEEDISIRLSSALHELDDTTIDILASDPRYQRAVNFIQVRIASNLVSDPTLLERTRNKARAIMDSHRRREADELREAYENSPDE